MAQIRGRLTTKQSGRRRRGSVELLIQFADDDVVQLEYALPPSQEEAELLRQETGVDAGTDWLIESCQFEIRVFDLRYK